MADFKRPGVYVTENLTPSRAIPSPSTSVAAFVGEHYRGPSTAVLCQSWGDFVANFGGFPPASPVLANPWLAWSVYNFFNNGGQQCYVARIISTTGTPAAAATHVFNDQASVTPLPTLTLSAQNVGTWGNAIYIDILARGVASGRFDINVYFGGTQAGNIVEKWQDLSMVASDPRYAPNLINAAVGGSAYIRATDDNSTTAAPNNAPAVVSAVQLTGGIDPASPTQTEKIAAMTSGSSPLDNVTGLLNLNLPGETNTGVINAATGYGAARGNVFVVIDTPSGQTTAQAVAYLQSLNPTSYGAIYYPWLNAFDPANATPNSTRLMPPGGMVLGQYSRNDAQRGVWHAPAGIGTRLPSLISAERLLANADLDSLNSSNVNAIRTTPQGIVVWGTRTMVTTIPLMYIPVRRTLMYIEEALKQGTLWAVFEPNDATLWATLTQIVTNFLTGLWQQRGLQGSTPADAFIVTCDGTINTPTTTAQGIVNIQVGVALLKPAEFINILIGQWQGGSSATIAA